MTACVPIRGLEPIPARDQARRGKPGSDGRLPQTSGCPATSTSGPSGGPPGSTPASRTSPSTTAGTTPRGRTSTRSRRSSSSTSRREPGRYRGPEGQVLLAEWCLEVGLPDEAIKILDALAAVRRQGQGAVQAEHQGGRRGLRPGGPGPTGQRRADRAGERLEGPARVRRPCRSDKHYALVHQDNIQDSANRRLAYLEDTFKTVYIWFALRGKALPAPTEKLVGVIVGDGRPSSAGTGTRSRPAT